MAKQRKKISRNGKGWLDNLKKGFLPGYHFLNKFDIPFGLT